MSNKIINVGDNLTMVRAAESTKFIFNPGFNLKVTAIYYHTVECTDADSNIEEVIEFDLMTLVQAIDVKIPRCFSCKFWSKNTKETFMRNGRCSELHGSDRVDIELNRDGCVFNIHTDFDFGCIEHQEKLRD